MNKATCGGFSILILILLFASPLFAQEDLRTQTGTLLFSLIHGPKGVELQSLAFYESELRIRRIKVPQPWKALLLDSVTAISFSGPSHERTTSSSWDRFHRNLSEEG